MKFKVISLFTFFLFGSSISSAMSLADYIAETNPEESEYISNLLVKNGEKYNISPLFLAAVFRNESGFHNGAISSAGAIGVSQLMPDTAAELGVNPYSLEENIEGGARYLRQMLDLHANKGDQQYNFALASYNAGYGNATHSIPSYTYDYINSIQSDYYTIKRSITGIYSKSPTVDSTYTKKMKLLNLYKLKSIKQQYQARKKVY